MGNKPKNKTKNKNKEVGRPTKYRPEFATIAKFLCIRGAIDAELAKVFQVNEDTINEWKKKYPEFSESISQGKSNVDDDVENALLRNALGYEEEAEQIFCTKFGHIVRAEYIKKHKAETKACIHWLQNRRPEKWGKKKSGELDGNIVTELPVPVWYDATKESPPDDK